MRSRSDVDAPVGVLTWTTLLPSRNLGEPQSAQQSSSKTAERALKTI